MIREMFMRLFFTFVCLFLGSIQGLEKSIVVVIPSYNNKEWYKRNLDSVVSQEYQNFHIIYIDDVSTDGTGKLVQEYIRGGKLDHLVTFIQNKERVGPLGNIYKAVWLCNPSDIVIIVDGDDWLYHEGVLQRINDVYEDPGVWMTYGQKIEYPTGYSGGAKLIPYEVILNNDFREYDWVATHLRTFYAGLFQKIKKEDFLYEGKFFPVAGDLASTFPMLELSGSHSRFIPDILYVYNVANPLNEGKLYLDQQMYFDSYIRKLPRYEPVERLFDISPLVTCDLRGGLGNQLFQIATTLAYAWDYDANPIFPDLNRTEVRISDNKDRIFFRLDTGDSPRPFQTSFQESNWHSSEKIPFQIDQKLFGYFMSWERFDRYRDKILSLLAPSHEILRSLTAKYDDLISNPNSVGIHVRTFNLPLHNSKRHPFLGLEYYKKAMDLFPPETIFVIFSDRILWCKKHFPSLGKNFIFVEENDPVQNLFLMSRMKHNIIANSSYSWWGAYLNQNPDKIVIAPTSWMHPDLDPFPLIQPNEFYLPDWKLVTPDYSAPYPPDMTWYETTIDDFLFN